MESDIGCDSEEGRCTVTEIKRCLRQLESPLQWLEAHENAFKVFLPEEQSGHTDRWFTLKLRLCYEFLVK